MDSVKYLGCLLQLYLDDTIEVNSDILPFICPQFYAHYTTEVNIALCLFKSSHSHSV